MGQKPTDCSSSPSLIPLLPFPSFLTDDKGPRGEEKVLPLRPFPPPATDPAADVLVDGEQRRLRPVVRREN